MDERQQMDEKQLELYRLTNEEQTKYCYFLMAVSASAIALCINRTTGQPLLWSMLPLGMAVLCWAGSFFCGCRNRVHHIALYRANAKYLKVQTGGDPVFGVNPSMIHQASEMLSDLMSSLMERAATYWAWQFYLIVAGGILFLAWHVLTMVARTGP